MKHWWAVFSQSVSVYPPSQNTTGLPVGIHETLSTLGPTTTDAMRGLGAGTWVGSACRIAG